MTLDHVERLRRGLRRRLRGRGNADRHRLVVHAEPGRGLGGCKRHQGRPERRRDADLQRIEFDRSQRRVHDRSQPPVGIDLLNSTAALSVNAQGATWDNWDGIAGQTQIWSCSDTTYSSCTCTGPNCPGGGLDQPPSRRGRGLREHQLGGHRRWPCYCHSCLAQSSCSLTSPVGRLVRVKLPCASVKTTSLSRPTMKTLAWAIGSRKTSSAVKNARRGRRGGRRTSSA